MNTIDNPIDTQTQAKKKSEVTQLLGLLYAPEQVARCANKLAEIIDRSSTLGEVSSREQTNSALLITYADSIRSQDDAPLEALKKFLDSAVGDALQRVHLLPFFPSSSDDGFAVIDYRRVDHHVGDWTHVASLAENYQLMFDLVINHCSREHLWFADFVGGRLPGKDYFITLPENTDTSAVVRPRSSPLISNVPTYAGIRNVWTTFSADQVDLDFTNPDVLIEFVEILFFYIERGARLIRLDAVAFLWKRLGTGCMSLQETHVVVKILRALVSQCSADVLLITETNVPHEENASYYGAGDEAHGIYQFSLAPLLLYGYTFANAEALTNWAQELEPLPAGCTALNFMASHDGIGLRPLEGLVSDREVDALVNIMKERGGFASMRDSGQGGQRPYEINISLFSAFGGEQENLAAYQGAHALLFAFQGTPTLYIHSLLASCNDLAKVEETGRLRSINRGTLELEALQAELADAGSVRSSALEFLLGALRVRAQQPAFAINAGQRVLRISPEVFVLERKSKEQTILVAASVSASEQAIRTQALGLTPGSYSDLLGGAAVTVGEELSLAAYQTLWLDITHHCQGSL